MNAESGADRRKRLALVAAIMGSFVAGLDATAVNVALPAIRVDLGGGLAGQQWVSNAYLLTLGSLILVGGSLGDVFGERRVFAVGVAGFGLVSGLCALAPSIELLIAGRALQGAFGALLTPSALALIIAAFPAAERGAAIGSWTAWSAIATVIGPLAGGYLVDAVSWRLIFAINVPFVVLTLLLIKLAVPARERGAAHARVDWLGAVLTFLGLAGPVLALIRQPVVGWSSPEVWGPGLGGLVLLVAFLLHERRSAQSMLPLSLFGRRNFAVGNVQTFVMYAGLSVTFFFLVLFLQEVAGYGALQAGLAMMPATLVMFALSKRAGRLADRFGPRVFMGLGPLTAAVGLALMQRLGAELSYFSDLLPALMVFSIGLACTVAPLTATVLSQGFSLPCDGTPIGKDLEAACTVTIGQAAPAGGVPVTLSSNNPNLLLSSTATGAGSSSIVVTIPAGSTTATYFAQALAASGTVTHTASSPGFNSRTATNSLAPSGVVISGPNGQGIPFFSASVSGGPVPVTVSFDVLNANGSDSGLSEALRGGISSVQVSLNSSNPSVGTITSPVTISSGSASATAQFTPLSPGSTTISVASTPAGFTTATNHTSLQAQVSQ